MNIYNKLLPAHLIYNPRAGSLQGSTVLIDRAVEILRAAGIYVALRPTARPDHATELAAEASRAGASMVIAAGGDGTVNEVANGLIGTQTPLAILPAGTACVLAMEMRIGKNVAAAAKMIPNMVPRRIAVGRFIPEHGAPRHFLLMAGAGMDAMIADSVDPELKRRFGKLAYWWAGFKATGHRLAQMEARANGVVANTGFALAARVRNYGGDLEIARQVTLFDDTFEFAFFRGRTTFPFTMYLGAAALRLMEFMPGVTLGRAKSLELRPLSEKPILVQLDGEVVGRLPAMIDIVPDALTLMVPRDLEARYQPG